MQASLSEIPLGIGSIVDLWHFTYSAYPPPVTRAQTFSFRSSLSIPLPQSTMLPETSSPSISEAPLGGGY